MVDINGAYLVCTTPRSGSWLLCEGLHAAGVGRPRECFADAFWETASEGPDQFADAWQSVLTEGTSWRGVFGAQIHWYQFEQLAVVVANSVPRAASPSAALLNLLPGLHYIWLRRRDKVRQAISYYRASTTGQWWWLNGARQSAPSTSAPGEPLERGIHAAIRNYEDILTQHDNAWHSYFSSIGVTPTVTIEYEELSRAYSETIRRVLSALIGEAFEARDIPPPRLRRQADEVTVDWAERYRAAEQIAPALALSVQAAKSRARDSKALRRRRPLPAGLRRDDRPLRVWSASEVVLWQNQYATGYFSTARSIVRSAVVGWLSAEAVQRAGEATLLEWNGRFEGRSGFFHGSMRYRASGAGPRLLWLQRHPQLSGLLRSVTGAQEIRATRASYNYYRVGDHIDRHVDLPDCDLTVLIGILGAPPPLVLFPTEDASRSSDGIDELRGSAGVAVPVGGGGALLVLNGAALAHERRSSPDAAHVSAVATMCYACRRARAHHSLCGGGTTGGGTGGAIGGTGDG
jgi:LPS sulfotransferase NodH